MEEINQLIAQNVQFSINDFDGNGIIFIIFSLYIKKLILSNQLIFIIFVYYYVYEKDFNIYRCWCLKREWY